MIKQEQDGTYTVSYCKRHPITRKPKSLRRIGIKTKAEAQRVFQTLVVEVNKAHETSGSQKMSWNDFLLKYEQDMVDRDLKNATIENCILCLRAHTGKKWAWKTLGDISPSDIREVIRGDLKDRSRSHQKNMRKYINGAFKCAVEMGYVSNNPTPRMQFREGQKLKPVLKESEVATLLAKAEEYNHPWQPIWTVAVYAGLRNEELYTLRWVNVDLETRLIYVRESWTKKDGHKDLTKTGDDRVVEIAPPLLKFLKELEEKKEGPYVLPRIEEWDQGRQAEILRTFLLGINLPRVNFHNLRATWCTTLLAKGVEPVKVMKMGGWKDLKTLTKHYLRLSGVDIKGASDVLDFKKKENNMLISQLNSEDKK